jgi:glyoxylase-like metal-dependent hydrolase (beta-lactamase superfamily II)
LTRATLPQGLTVFERGWLSSNNVLLRGDSGPTTLIDSGYFTHSAQTLALVGTALQGNSLDLLLNTHLHSDHCGGNAALQAHYPALHTAIPPGEAEAVARWDEAALSFEGTGQHCPRFRHDGLLTPGADIALGGQHWQVHAAPGHDPHSVILFEPQTRTLISADALWENGFGVVFPELLGEPAFDQVAATLELIERLAPRLVIPGHGLVFSDVASALRTARGRLERQATAPERHAWHAMKVLLKFKLLELGQTERTALRRWFGATPYMALVRQRYFNGYTPLAMFEQLIDELAQSGAVNVEDERVMNS